MIFICAYDGQRDPTKLNIKYSSHFFKMRVLLRVRPYT